MGQSPRTSCALVSGTRGVFGCFATCFAPPTPPRQMDLADKASLKNSPLAWPSFRFLVALLYAELHSFIQAWWYIDCIATQCRPTGRKQNNAAMVPTEPWGFSGRFRRGSVALTFSWVFAILYVVIYLKNTRKRPTAPPIKLM